MIYLDFNERNNYTKKELLELKRKEGEVIFVDWNTKYFVNSEGELELL